jgi:rubredoxin
MDRLTAIATFEEPVDAGCECPFCGEARMDWLIMSPEGLEHPTDNIKCVTCGHVYQLPEAA